ncbi:MAG TPA: GNAT family N-acetyltransferase, partial [Alteromonas sp.]|nr:GNAT family N-acetyltransferase [Alteromonas sp.]
MITLRSFVPADVPELVKLLNDGAVTRFLSTKIPQPYTPDDASWWVEEGSLLAMN